VMLLGLFVPLGVAGLERRPVSTRACTPIMALGVRVDVDPGLGAAMGLRADREGLVSVSMCSLRASHHALS